jgi:hypothetical protein
VGLFLSLIHTRFNGFVTVPLKATRGTNIRREDATTLRPEDRCAGKSKALCLCFSSAFSALHVRVFFPRGLFVIFVSPPFFFCLFLPASLVHRLVRRSGSCDARDGRALTAPVPCRCLVTGTRGTVKIFPGEFFLYFIRFSACQLLFFLLSAAHDYVHIFGALARTSKGVTFRLKHERG